MFKKSVVFINCSRRLDRGGAGKMTMFVANICSTMFEKVSVILLSDGGRPESLDNRISFINLPRDKGHNLFYWRIKEISQLRRSIKNLAPDIVCPFVSEIAVVTKFATLGMHVIFCSAERGDPYTLNFLWKVLTFWTYKHSDFCFFQLEKARDFFGEKVASKSFVIPNPYLPKNDTKPFDGDRNKTIVSAGRFEKQKCYDILIDAFFEVHQKHPEYVLILFGDGSLLDQYENQVAKLGLIDYVVFPGYTTDVPTAIREEGIFVLPSLYEGIPNTLIDALSVGMPVVSTDCTPGGPYFLTEGGNNGILVPVKNVKKMADAICTLIENPALAKKMSQRGPLILLTINKDRIIGMWKDAFNFIASGR